MMSIFIFECQLNQRRSVTGVDLLFIYPQRAVGIEIVNVIVGAAFYGAVEQNGGMF